METHIILLSFHSGTNIEKQSSNFHTFFFGELDMAMKRCSKMVKSLLKNPLTFRLIPGGSFPFSLMPALQCTGSVLPFWIQSYIPKYVVCDVCVLWRTTRCAAQRATHVFAICFRTRSKQAISYGVHPITPPARTGETQASPSTRSAHINSISSSRRWSTTRRRWRTRRRKKWIRFYYWPVPTCSKRFL